jgi:putative alpha-1,2-mannosidase
LSGHRNPRYILNALGLYPLSPASGDYVLGSPLFANVTITLGGGGGSPTALVVSALNQHRDHPFVQRATFNGTDVSGVRVAFADLAMGGVLEFTMGPEPASVVVSVIPAVELS